MILEFPLVHQFTPGVEQQVKPLVIADIPKKHRIVQRRIQSQSGTRLLAWHRIPVVAPHWVRRKEGRLGSGEQTQILMHLLRHIDKPIDRRDKITGQQRIKRPFFMGDHIIQQSQSTNPSPPCNPAHGTERRSHHRNPITHDQHVRTQTTHLQTSPNPGKRIDTAQFPGDIEPFGSRIIGILGGTRKEQ